MNANRLKELRMDYQNALQRLNEGAVLPVDNAIVIDGVIQRFEFTFELAWKWLQVYLRRQGVEVHGPRPVIKEAFSAGLLQDGEGWINMLEDRNRTSHIYDESEARQIYQRITSLHLGLLQQLPAQIGP